MTTGTLSRRLTKAVGAGRRLDDFSEANMGLCWAALRKMACNEPLAITEANAYGELKKSSA